MKTFKEFVLEAMGTHVPVVSLDKEHSDISNTKTVNEINKNLKLELSQEFESIDVAIHKIRKILSMYSIELGDINIPDDKFHSGTLKIPVSQASITGAKVTPEVDSGEVTSLKEPLRKTDLSLNVSYSEGDYGYSVSALVK